MSWSLRPCLFRTACNSSLKVVEPVYGTTMRSSADAPDEMRITESSKIVYSEAMEAILEDIDEDAMSDDSDDDEVLDDEVLSGDD